MSGACQLVVACEPHLVEAILWAHPDVDNETFETKISPLVKMDDPCQLLISEFLSGVCARETDWETVEDTFWMFGEYKHTVYTVFSVCPGESVEHLCRIRRIETAGGKDWTRH